MSVKFEKNGIVGVSGQTVGKNLHKDSSGLGTSWVKNQATVTNGIATIMPTANSDRRIYQLPANGYWTWQASTVYTASIDAKSSNGATLVFYPYGAGTVTYITSSSTAVSPEWKRYYCTFTSGSSVSTGSMTYSVNQTSGVTLELKCPKLELGNKATAWLPNEADSGYVDITQGFIEDNSNMKTFPDYIQAREFIEW